MKNITKILFISIFLNIQLFALTDISKNMKIKIENNKTILSGTSKEGNVFYEMKNKTFKTYLSKNIKLKSNFRENKKNIRYFLYIFSLKNKNNDLKRLFKIFYPDNKIFLEGSFASFLDNKKQTNLKTTRYKRIYDFGIFSFIKDASVINIYNSNSQMKKFIKNKKTSFSFLILERSKKENKYNVKEIFCKNILLKDDSTINYFKKMLKLSKIKGLNKEPNTLLKKNNVVAVCKEIIYDIKDKNDIKELNNFFLKKAKIYNINGKEIKK